MDKCKRKIHRISLRLTDEEFNVLVSRSHRKAVFNGEEFDIDIPISTVIRELIDLVVY